jgi:hydroxyacyl-ACP dehydratase HTD2-like protein with hotdog domain
VTDPSNAAGEMTRASLDNPPIRYYEDAQPGELVGPVTYGPMTIMHLVRWCAAMENWHRIHYDYLFCTEHEGLAGPVINGSWKQQVLAQLLKDWAGPTGWVQDLSFQFRGMDIVGEQLRVQGKVESAVARDGVGEIKCSLEITNSSGEATTIGRGTVLLPMRDGTAVPYPHTVSADVSDEPAPQSNRALCPPRYETFLGLESNVLVTVEPIDASAVRRFAQAIMVRDADYSDARSPGAQRFGSVVAPPLFPLHAFHDPVGATDPLLQALHDDEFDGASQTPWAGFGLRELPDAPKRILNGGNRVRLFAYAPLGSRVDVVSRYEDIYEKSGSQGPLLFVSVRSDYSVHETGQPLLSSLQTLILR